MFKECDETGNKEVLPSIRMKAVVYGDKTLMTESLLKAGGFLPAHDHIHEQTGYMVSGKMRFRIGEETFEVSPSDSWNIPGGVPHSADILDDSVAVEVFCSRRDEYIG
ncbi:cupin domain-containing protein [Methanosarcina sp. Mfa9]|uniref:cupin domain-containing protein n=1 Tax=Methanosarcina sp. Mfa9 TaxID=3439063 RepID=UPI003F84CA26